MNNSDDVDIVGGAYKDLGIPPSQAKKIAAAANQAMLVPHIALGIKKSQPKIKPAEINAYAVQLSQSGYFKTQPRMPTLSAMVDGRTFSDYTSHLIVEFPFWAQSQTNICDTSKIIPHLWKALPYIDTHTKVIGEAVLSALREIACLSAICHKLPARDFASVPNSEEQLIVSGFKAAAAKGHAHDAAPDPQLPLNEFLRQARAARKREP